MGNLNAVIRELSQAIFFQPDFANAYFNRGLIFEMTRGKFSALTDFQKYRDLGAGQQNGNQKEVKAKINMLKNKTLKKKSVKKKSK